MTKKLNNTRPNILLSFCLKNNNTQYRESKFTTTVTDR